MLDTLSVPLFGTFEGIFPHAKLLVLSFFYIQYFLYSTPKFSCIFRPQISNFVSIEKINHKRAQYSRHFICILDHKKKRLLIYAQTLPQN